MAVGLKQLPMYAAPESRSVPSLLGFTSTPGRLGNQPAPLEVAVAGIKRVLALRISPIIGGPVVGACLPVASELEEVVSELPAHVVLEDGIDLFGVNLVVVKSAGHNYVRIAVASSRRDRWYR